MNKLTLLIFAKTKSNNFNYNFLIKINKNTFYHYSHISCYIFMLYFNKKIKSVPVIRKSAIIYFTFNIARLLQRTIASIIPRNINQIWWYYWSMSNNSILISSRKESLWISCSGNRVFSPRRHNTDGCIACFREGVNCTHLDRQGLLISQQNRKLR